jgi:hypothetical protein
MKTAWLILIAALLIMVIAAALERVTAERDALVKALEKIAACSPERPHISAQAGFGHALGTLDKARGIARAALATKGDA